MEGGWKQPAVVVDGDVGDRWRVLGETAYDIDCAVFVVLKWVGRFLCPRIKMAQR